MEKSKKLIAEFPKDGEPRWLHVSYNESSNRNSILIAVKIKKKTTYVKYEGNEHYLSEL
jgi:hypothetical protein